MVIKRNFSAELPNQIPKLIPRRAIDHKRDRDWEYIIETKVAPSATIVGRLINEQQNIMSQPHTWQEEALKTQTRKIWCNFEVKRQAKYSMRCNHKQKFLTLAGAIHQLMPTQMITYSWRLAEDLMLFALISTRMLGLLILVLLSIWQREENGGLCCYICLQMVVLLDPRMFCTQLMETNNQLVECN